MRYKSSFCHIVFLCSFLGFACTSPGSFGEAERSEKLGRYSTAIEQYETFSKTHARDKSAPKALFRIGEIYRSVIGDQAKSQRHYRNVIEWYPASSWAREADWALMNCPDYFPFEEGKKIFGDSQSGGANMRVVEVIQPLKDQRERIALKREIFAGEIRVSSVTLGYEKKDMGLKEFPSGKEAGTTILQFPLSKGKAWQAVKEGKIFTCTVEEDDVSVKVKGGTFDRCVKIKIQQKDQPNVWKVEYYAPLAGLILAATATPKQETRIMELLSLKEK